MKEKTTIMTSHREKKSNTIGHKPAIGFGTVRHLTHQWNQKANKYIEKQMMNPFSGRYCDSIRRKWVKGSRDYARPVGKTAERGENAKRFITKQINMLCQVIAMMGDVDNEGKIFTTFGQLFERYTRISDNVVGLLIRARKRHLVDFPGEMLWQRRDDDVIIALTC